MKAIVTCFFLFVFVSKLAAQEPLLEWAKGTGGEGEDRASSMCIDNWGNIYSTGFFTNTVDFDPGPGTFNLTATGNKKNIFILKLDAKGNFVWAKQLEGGDGESSAIACDKEGNVYTAGSFSETVDFDPGPGAFPMTESIKGNYILQLNTHGEFVWVQEIEGGIHLGIYAVTADADGNVFATGYFFYTVDFDPGPGVFNLTGSDLYISQVFILKLNRYGNFVWARHLYSDGDFSLGGGASAGKAITTDAMGNVIVGGHFSLTVDFDPGPGSYNLSALIPSTNGFILKLDASGNYIWAKQFGKVNTPGQHNRYKQHWVSVNSLDIDDAGNIVSTGHFTDTIDFDPGPGVHEFATSYYLEGNQYQTTSSDFISSIDADGNFNWANQLGEANTYYALSSDITADKEGNIYVTGYGSGTFDFDPGPGNTNTVLFSDAFIIKYTSTGALLWINQFPRLSHSNIHIEVDDQFNIYTAGAFAGVIDFDPSSSVNNLSSAGGYDAFFQKLRQCFDSTSSQLAVNTCNTYVLNGQLFTNSGTYTQVIPNYKNCDSLITLNVIINGGASEVESARACTDYTWRGTTYYSSGTYMDTLKTQLGCDSILELRLVVGAASPTNITRAICQGQEYQGYRVTGIYKDTLASVYGCDSIINLQLWVNDHSYSYINAEICSGEQFEGYTMPGYYTDTILAANGCDSIRNITIVDKERCLPFSLPNAFTPNDDGLNDLFRPVIQEEVQQYRMEIYNRYGEKLYDNNNHLQGWDGKYKGKPQHSGVYVYRIYCRDTSGRVYNKKGSVVLTR